MYLLIIMKKKKCVVEFCINTHNIVTLNFIILRIDEFYYDYLTVFT